MKKLIQYEASNGERFDNAADCRRHEAWLKQQRNREGPMLNDIIKTLAWLRFEYYKPNPPKFVKGIQFAVEHIMGGSRIGEFVEAFEKQEREKKK